MFVANKCSPYRQSIGLCERDFTSEVGGTNSLTMLLLVGGGFVQIRIHIYIETQPPYTYTIDHYPNGVLGSNTVPCWRAVEDEHSRCGFIAPREGVESRKHRQWLIWARAL